MQDLPHHYTVNVAADANSNLAVTAENLPTFESAAPAAFGGPGDVWSPEDLLMAAIADCLILSFKAIARGSKLEWTSIECETTGKLEKVERKLLFTHIANKVKLVIPSGESEEKAEKLLQKAESSCLVTNSMTSEVHMECEIITA